MLRRVDRRLLKHVGFSYFVANWLGIFAPTRYVVWLGRQNKVERLANIGRTIPVACVRRRCLSSSVTAAHNNFILACSEQDIVNVTELT